MGPLRWSPNACTSGYCGLTAGGVTPTLLLPHTLPIPIGSAIEGQKARRDIDKSQGMRTVPRRNGRARHGAHRGGTADRSVDRRDDPAAGDAAMRAVFERFGGL
jgi:hypothetical protein